MDNQPENRCNVNDGNLAHAHWVNEGGAGVVVSPPLQSCACKHWQARDEEGC